MIELANCNVFDDHTNRRGDYGTRLNEQFLYQKTKTAHYRIFDTQGDDYESGKLE